MCCQGNRTQVQPATHQYHQASLRTAARCVAGPAAARRRAHRHRALPPGSLSPGSDEHSARGHGGRGQGLHDERTPRVGQHDLRRGACLRLLALGADRAGSVRTQKTIEVSRKSDCGRAYPIAPMRSAAPPTPRPSVLGRAAAARTRRLFRSTLGGSESDHAAHRGQRRSGLLRQRRQSRASDNSAA